MGPKQVNFEFNKQKIRLVILMVKEIHFRSVENELLETYKK